VTGVRSVHPPRALMRHVVNPVVRGVLRSPASRWTGSLLLLEFTGRRTGRRLSVPALGHSHDGAVYVMTDAPWAANFRGGAPVVVHGRGRRTPRQGVLVEDRTEAVSALRATLADSGARSLGLRMTPGWEPTDDELCAARRSVRLDPLR
jgi:hypothetical protein